MLENKWAREYLQALFESRGEGTEDLSEFVSVSGFNDVEDPLVEIGFLRQSNSPVQCFRLSVAALALCSEGAPLSLVSELVETVEECNDKLTALEDELPRLKEAVSQDPENCEKLAYLGFALLSADEREAALTAFTQALERPTTLCIYCHRDCLLNIGWDHYVRREYDEALGWFEHACQLRQPVPANQTQNHIVSEAQDDSEAPYKLALENVLLTLVKLGRLAEAASRVEEYHHFFGRLPMYESRALEKLGLQPDVIYIRSRIENHARGQTARGKSV